MESIKHRIRFDNIYRLLIIKVIKNIYDVIIDIDMVLHLNTNNSTFENIVNKIDQNLKEEKNKEEFIKAIIQKYPRNISVWERMLLRF